jgi:hypothetical protein
MAHFAKLDDNNIVIDVNVVNNAVLDSADEEGSGIAFLTEWSGGYSNWKQTSYNEKFRYNFAGIGFTYDPIDDAFIAPMPECGHEELLFNSLRKWECATCAAQAL